MKGEAWYSFKHFSGFDLAKDNIPMDALHATMAFRANPAVKIWQKTHAGAKKITVSEFKDHPAKPESAWIHVDAWLKAYSPHREGGFSVAELEIYEIPDFPFLINIQDTNFWIVVAPMITLSIKPNEVRRPTE